MFLFDIAQDISSFGLVRLGALALVLYLVSSSVYSLYFHPLAKYPGPFWARLSSFPSWIHTLRQDRHLWLYRLHEQYGIQVRYRPDSVAINTPTAFREITGPKGNGQRVQGYKIWPMNAGTCNTLQTIDNHEHGRKRRALMNAFSDKALRSYEPLVKQNVDRWCELLGDECTADGEWSKPLNAADWLNWFVFDVMGDLCFGKSFGMKEADSDMRDVLHLMANMMATAYPITVAPFAPLWIWLKPRGLDWILQRMSPPRLKAWQEWLVARMTERKATEEAAQRGEAKAPRNDFFTYLFKVRDPETGALGYSEGELWEECALLVVAGADTTAIVMSAILFYVIRLPEVQEKLMVEVQAAFKNDTEIAPGPKLHSCKYLRAVVLEGLRMAPPVAAELSREILPGGTVVDREFFPAGINLGTCTYALSYSEKVFPEPFTFRPERWLTARKEEDTNELVGEEADERALPAFSAGARGCAGKNLAWMEMMLLMAKLFYLYEVRKDPNSGLGGGSENGREGRRDPNHFQLYDTFVAARDGPMIQLKRRTHS